MEDLYKGFGILVDIKTSENFLKIKETLTRMGISPKMGKRLYQTCHILHKRDKDGNSHYAILHFKELFELDGKNSEISDEDIERRNRIAILLEEWKLLSIYDETLESNPDIFAPFAVISHSDKNDYNLISKYTIGNKGKNNEQK